MPVRPFLYSFNGGEVSPRFDGRADHQRYFASLRTCRNMILSPVGGADRRPGTRFLAAAKVPSQPARLMLFEFNITQGYLLEAGAGYLRFFRNQARLEASPGVPVEVATPYTTGQLFDIQTAQSADIMWWVHPSHPQQKLSRFSDTAWSFAPIPFDPPPSTETPQLVGETLTLSAVSGVLVTASAGAAVFLDGDVGRQIALISSQASLARATITALNSAAPTASITLSVLSPFPSVNLAANTWQLEGPLGVGLRIAPLTPTPLKGTLAKALLIQRGILAPELITNGGFTGLTGWTNHSGDVLASGTHNGGNNSPDLQDTTVNFPALGVAIGYRVVNTTDGSNANVTAIRPSGNALGMTLAGGADNDWDTGDSYSITGNGGAVAANGGAQMSGGGGGVGWLEQPVTTVNGQTYLVSFGVEEGPVSGQVGSTSKRSDLAAETSFAIGSPHEMVFTAVSATSYVQFRTNQPTMSRVVNVSVKNISAKGWPANAIGMLIKAHNGVFEILGLDNTHSANVLVRTMPDPINGAYVDIPAGAWTLEVTAWSATRGYPRAISFHQQRLGFAGTALQPLTIWQSETGNYEQFGASSLADSSLEQEVSANGMNVILWLEPFRDLLVGTARGEHVLRGVNGPLTPLNGEQLPQTLVGSEGLPPIRADNALILLMRGGRQIRELEYDQNGAVVRGKDHTLVAEHITAGGITQWAYQSRPTAILWAVRGDGALIGLTYEQFEQVQGWHPHTTRGAFESMCVVPVAAPVDAQTEEVYLSARRTIQGQDRRYIEVMDPTLTLDCALSYAGAPTTTITGLGHLEGETVSVIDKSAGPDQPTVLQDRVVTGGAITVEVPVTAADVGLSYETILQPLRPEVSLRDGTLQGRKKKWSKITARTLRTGGLLINGEEAIYREPEDAMDEGLLLRNGDFEVKGLGWDRDGYITLTQTQPLPCTILAVYGQLEVAED